MNALEEMKKRAEEAKLAEASEQLKEKQTRTREMLEAEIKAKQAIIENFSSLYKEKYSSIYEEEYIKNKEQFLNNIDMIADVGILKVEENFFNKSQELKDLTINEFVFKINQWREETKEKMMKEFDYLAGDIPASSDRKRTAMFNIRCKFKNDLERKLIDIKYKSFKKASGIASEVIPNMLIALSIVIDVAGIVLAIINRNFIIAILGLVFGGIIISIASKKHPDSQGDGIEGWNLVSILGGLHLFIISFIAGFGFHSFLVGLVGVIISIAPAIIIGIIEEFA